MAPAADCLSSAQRMVVCAAGMFPPGSENDPLVQLMRNSEMFKNPVVVQVRVWESVHYCQHMGALHQAAPHAPSYTHTQMRCDY